MRQEPLELAGAQVARMPPAVKVDISLQPLEIGLLGPQGQVPRAHALACRGEEAGQWLACGVGVDRHAGNPWHRWKQIAAGRASLKCGAIAEFQHPGYI